MGVAQLAQRFAADLTAVDLRAQFLVELVGDLGRGDRAVELAAIAGARRFNVSSISRKDLMSLTEECTKVTGISYIMNAYREEAEAILNGEELSAPSVIVARVQR